jgi:H+/Cl- antiporter ClcA
MTPQIPLATDSLHKFLCLLGLVLVLSGLLGFYGVYTTTLDKKVALSEEIAQLELNTQRSPIEDRRLELKHKILEVAKSNEQFFQWAVAAAFCIGLILIHVGGFAWHKKGQAMDDRFKELQVRKIELEVRVLEATVQKQEAASTPTGDA